MKKYELLEKKYKLTDGLYFKIANSTGNNGVMPKTVTECIHYFCQYGFFPFKHDFCESKELLTYENISAIHESFKIYQGVLSCIDYLIPFSEQKKIAEACNLFFDKKTEGVTHWFAADGSIADLICKNFKEVICNEFVEELVSISCFLSKKNVFCFQKESVNDFFISSQILITPPRKFNLVHEIFKLIEKNNNIEKVIILLKKGVVNKNFTTGFLKVIEKFSIEKVITLDFFGAKTGFDLVCLKKKQFN